LIVVVFSIDTNQLVISLGEHKSLKVVTQDTSAMMGISLCTWSLWGWFFFSASWTAFRAIRTTSWTAFREVRTAASWLFC
jgi:hypothetical protein